MNKTREIIEWKEKLRNNEMLLCKDAGVEGSPAMAT